MEPLPTPRSPSSVATRFLRQWWPAAAIFGCALIAQKLSLSGYEARGHAAGHLGSAGALFPMMAVFAVIVWVSASVRRRPAVWAIGLVLSAGLVLRLVGDLRVVNAINGEIWSDAQADVLGPARAGFSSGHDMTQVGSLIAVLATVVLALILRARRQVGHRVAVAAIVVSVVIPYFIIPGAGIVVLAVALCVDRFRRQKSAAALSG